MRKVVWSVAAICVCLGLWLLLGGQKAGQTDSRADGSGPAIDSAGDNGEGAARDEALPEPGASSFEGEAVKIEGFPFTRLDREGDLLEERFVVGGEGVRVKRIRLVETESFPFPVRIEYGFERDESRPGAGERVVYRREMAANRALVQLRDGVGLEEARALLESSNAAILREVGGTHAYEMEFAEANIGALEAGMAWLEAFADSLVMYAEPNYIVHAMANPDDAEWLAGSLWGLENLGQNDGSENVDIDAEAGWSIRSDAQGIVVAVVDTGINYRHEDLAGNMWANPGEVDGNGIDDDGNGVIDDVRGINVISGDGDPQDDNGHGSHCAGIVGAEANNGIGTVGVAWEVELMAVKFLSASGSGTTADAIEGIDYAVRMGADVVSASWGGSPYSQALRDAIAGAGEAGVAFVAAAGNAATDIGEAPTYPAAYQLPNIVTVASVDRFGKLSPFSNYGAFDVDLAAPGSEILSTWMGGTSAYREISGTSMATPYVAGIVALALAEYPEGGMEGAIGRVVHGTKDLDTLTNRVASGGMASLARSLALVEVPDPPVFLRRPPTRIHLPEGGSTVIEADVASESIPSYQWFFNGQALEDATELSLRLDRVNPEEAGTYRIEASNGDGTIRAETELSVLQRIAELEEASEASPLSLYRYGDGAWEAYGFDSVRGASCIRSLNTPNDGISAAFTEARGPGRLTFSWRLSSEPYWDYGELALDGMALERLRFSRDWEERVIELDEDRTYRIEWRYRKDGSGVAGQDSLFVDAIRFEPSDAAPPTIVTQPVGGTLSSGAVYALFVEAIGSGLSYQWMKDGATIAGADEAWLILEDAGGGVEGDYEVVVSNGNGATRSRVARVQIADIPVRFVVQPDAAEAAAGTRVELSAEVAGSLPLSLQWFKDGAVLSGETGVALVFDPVLPEHAGSYRLRASNAATSEAVWSAIADLKVEELKLAPRIVKHPRSGYYQSGSEIRLSGAAEGSLPMEIQWYKEGESIGGATGRTLVIESAVASDSGRYSFQARNAFGASDSEWADVRVVGDLSDGLDTPDLEWDMSGEAYFFLQEETTFDGEDALQSAEHGSFFPRESRLTTHVEGPATLRLRWKQEAKWAASKVGLYVDEQLTAYSGAVRDWHAVNAWVPDGTHEIRVEALVEAGSTLWLDQVELVSEPVVFGQASSRALEAGEDLRLWIDAKGAGEMSRQWFRDGSALAGETQSELIVQSGAKGIEGRYRVDTTNAYGTVSSKEMRVAVAARLGEAAGDGSVLLESKGGDWEGALVGQDAVVLASDPLGGDWQEIIGAVQGPGTLVFDLGLKAEGCCSRVTVLLDDAVAARYVDAVEVAGLPPFRERTLNIPVGIHPVVWRFERGEGSLPYSSIAYLRNLRLETGPVFSRHPQRVRLVEGETATFSVSMASEESVTFQWYRNGSALEGETQAVLRVGDADSSDAGNYWCVAVDGDGERAVSRSAALEVVDGFYEALGLDFGRIVIGGEHWEVVQGEGVDGGSSIVLPPGVGRGRGTAAFDINVPEGEKLGFEFWIRLEGLVNGRSVLAAENGSKRIRIDAVSGEWKRVRLPLSRSGANRVSLSLGDETSEIRVGLDAFRLVAQPLYYSEPLSLSRYWGESATFGPIVTGRRPIQSVWSRYEKMAKAETLNGSEEPLLQIDRTNDRTAGPYRLSLANAYGQSEEPEVRLRLIESGYGEAVGAPGASIWSEGNGLWQVDGGQSFWGSKSLTVSGLEEQEHADLIWWVRGPGTLSLHWRMDTPKLNERLALFVGNFQVNGLFASSDWAPVEVEIDSQFYQVRARFSAVGSSGEERGRAWVDAVRFTNAGGLIYDDWADAVFAGAGLPEADRSLEGDPDADGLPNFVEYALTLDPFSFSELPTVRILGAGEARRALVEFSFEALADDVTYGLEFSRDLQTWYPVRSQFLVTPDVGEARGTLLYRFGPGDLDATLFARFAVYYLGREE